MREFSFDIENTLLPSEIIEDEFVPLIKRITKEYLYARLEAYKGPIFSYETESVSVTVATSLGLGKEKTIYHNIQDELGEINKAKNTYEFYIGSEDLGGYKFRVFFIRFGKAGYPATVVLDEDLSLDIRYPKTIDKSYICKIDTMEEMRKLLDSIRDSETFFSVLQEAINASIIEKRKKEKDSAEDNRKIKEVLNN